MEQINNTTNNTESQTGLTLKTVIEKLFIYWRWFVLSILVCLFCAFVYLRYSTNVYSVQAKIMINDEHKGGYQNQMMALQDFGYMGNSSGIDNEIEVLNSKSLVKQAVLDKKFYIQYTMTGRLSKSCLYPDSPIEVEIGEQDVEEMKRGISIAVREPEEGRFTFSYEWVPEGARKAKEYSFETTTFPYVIDSPVGKLVFTKEPDATISKAAELTISIIPPIKVARSFLGRLSINPTSKFTSVATIGLTDISKARGVDFVNALIEAYNVQNNADKNIVGYKTEEFINSRILKVAAELDETEGLLASYKSNSGLTNLTGDAAMVLQSNNEYEKKRAEVSNQLSLIKYLKEYVNDPANHLKVVPANVGVADATLSAVITRYNEAVIERNRLLRVATESNPSVIEMTTQAEQMATTVKTSIESLYNALVIQMQNADYQVSKYSNRINKAPTQEKELAKYERQKEVQQGLYLMLLQKREENSLAIAATADNAKIIDAAMVNDYPVAPKRNMVWLIALLLGIAIPVGIIYVLELMRYRIEGRNDLEKLTTLPILGDVALSHNLSKNERAIVVRENDNDTMAETFRAIRTNLQFMLGGTDKKVVLFTSTTSGEGKTFVSSNMAMSLALLGKKVILLGLDIRKPRLAELFKLKDRQKGITTFLSGDMEDRELLFDQIQPSGISDNLDVLTAGVIPPNPSELLSRPNLGRAIEYLRERYDYIILDTAPVGLVTDSLLISPLADANIYVTRADYTNKSDITLPNSLSSEGKMKNMAIVLNGVDMKKRKYGYYYGYGGYGKYGRYGYGKYGKYGYGYGYSYGSHNSQQKK